MGPEVRYQHAIADDNRLNFPPFSQYIIHRGCVALFWMWLVYLGLKLLTAYVDVREYLPEPLASRIAH